MAPICSVFFAFAVLIITGSPWLADGSLGEDFAVSSGSPSVVRAAVGSVANLSCSVPDANGSAVGWIRKEDLRILAVGSFLVTRDLRFRLRADSPSDGRMLQIHSVEIKDAGVYECFDSSTTTNRHVVRLSVVEPETKIVGEPVRYFVEGTSVNLTCVIEPSPASEVFVEWTRETGDEMVHLRNNGHITTLVEKRGCSLRSTLLIHKIHVTEAGNYTCAPSEGKNATVTVHVAHGESGGGTDEARPSTSNGVLSKVDSGSSPEVTTEGASRKDAKRNLDKFETEETSGLTLTEIQRLVQLRQLKVLSLQEEANKLQIEVLNLEKEKLLWMKEQRLRHTEN